MYTVVSVIVTYIRLHASLLIVRIALKIAFPFLSEKSLKEVILDPEFHKNILLIYGILLGISLLMAIIAKII
ncbi:hypothetical protein IGJ83_003152 [Enterococcus pernyi]